MHVDRYDRLWRYVLETVRVEKSNDSVGRGSPLGSCLNVRTRTAGDRAQGADDRSIARSRVS